MGITSLQCGQKIRLTQQKWLSSVLSQSLVCKLFLVTWIQYKRIIFKSFISEYSSNSKSFLYLLLLFLFSSCKTYLLSQKKFIAIEYHDVNNRNAFSYEKQKEPISFSRSNPKWKQRQSDNRNILTRFITSPSFINSPFHCLLSLDYDNPIITYVNTTIC